MPQFWIAIFFILLAITELYQSVKAIELPFPVYLVLGTLLAVASNYHHQTNLTSIAQTTISEIAEPSPVLSSASLPVLPTADPNSTSSADSLSQPDPSSREI
jgi:hypothetical protein